MFRTRTTIVVGAGASVEVGLPTGEGLTTKIAESLNFHSGIPPSRLSAGSDTILRAIKKSAADMQNREEVLERLFQAAKLIHGAMPLAPSIDNFINSHRDNKEVEICGKLAIVQAILEAERQSDLFLELDPPQTSLDVSSLGGTWFNAFVQLLTENCTFEEIPERLNNITFIVFNYDRCIEHYLYFALQAFYGISGRDAAGAMSRMKVLHPYGSIGGLKWQNGLEVVDYGAPVNAGKLLSLSEKNKNVHGGH